MRGALLLFALTFLGDTLFAQNVYTIKADSVKLTGCDSSELIIENHTQGVPGFLYNTGHGRTVFKRGVVKLSGGLYLIGADTLNLGANAWVQGGNSFGAAGVLGTLDNNHLNFYTNDTLRSRLTNTGNLLLGTTTDNGFKLQVNGGAYVKDAYVNGPFTQVFNNTATFGNGLYFDTYPSPVGSRIFSSEEIIYQSNYGGDQHLFENSVGAEFGGTLVTMDPGYYPSLSDSQLTLKVLGKVGTLGMAVNMLGQVGIGTLYPAAQLHTTGTVRFAGLTNDSTQTRVLVSDAGGNLYYRSASSLAMDAILHATLAKDSTINSSLAVNGEITARKLRLKQVDWPDYVFSKSYVLPSLQEIAQYIQRNSHLPGVPSAGEIERNGADVGENQATLLKKIEELTLYSIAQEQKLQVYNEKMERQEKDMETLKKELDTLRKLIINKPDK